MDKINVIEGDVKRCIDGEAYEERGWCIANGIYGRYLGGIFSKYMGKRVKITIEVIE